MDVLCMREAVRGWRNVVEASYCWKVRPAFKHFYAISQKRISVQTVSEDKPILPRSRSSNVRLDKIAGEAKLALEFFDYTERIPIEIVNLLVG